MKRFLFFLSFCLMVKALHAEYGGHYLQFSIETIAGEQRVGYTFVGDAYLDEDSIYSTPYLIGLFSNFGYYAACHEQDLNYYEGLILYHYLQRWDSIVQPDSRYALAGKTSIRLASIRRLEITSRFRGSTMAGILNPMRVSDARWMWQSPLQDYQFGAALDFYQVFVHRSSPRVRRILRDLEALKAVKRSLDRDYDKDGVSLGQEYGRLLRQLEGERVLVVYEGSC